MTRLCLISTAIALAVSVAMVAGCPADGRDCHAVGCGPSTYQLGSEAWPPGDYEIAITYEQSGRVEATCALRIEAELERGDDDAGVEYEPPMAECSQNKGGLVSVSFSDRAFVRMPDSPSSFQLSIESAGRVLFDETITPEYTSAEINGPGCGVCSNTNDTIDVADALR